MKQEELVETLMDMVPTMVASAFVMKMLGELYRENPQMFWSYLRGKNSQFIYNCRM